MISPVACFSRFVFAPTRGHDTISSFTVHPATGKLTLASRVPAERSPRGVELDPAGRFLYAAGNNNGKLAVFSVNQNNGVLTRVHTYELGEGIGSASWLLPLELPSHVGRL